MPKHEWLCKLWNLLGWKGFNRKNNKTWLEIDNSSIVYCLLHFSCKMQNWFWFEKHIDSIAFVGVRWCHIVVGVSSFVNHSYGTLPVSIPLQPVKVSKFYVGCHLNSYYYKLTIRFLNVFEGFWKFLNIFEHFFNVFEKNFNPFERFFNVLEHFGTFWNVLEWFGIF